MKPYVIYRDRDRIERYWTGEWTPTGAPQQTSDIDLAFRFTTADLAYRSAGRYRRFDNWKVGVRR